jgi:Family of unknown function (DUF5640)
MPRNSVQCLLMAAFLLSLCFLVPGCSKSKQALIVGTWKPTMGMNLQMVFNSDGTCTFANYNGKYRIDGNSLIMTSPAIGSDQPVDDTFTILTLDDKNLSMQDKDGRQDFVRVP